MAPGVVAQIKESPKKGTPVKFELLVPQLDLSIPEDKKQLEGQVSDTFNPEVLEIPRSGSGKAYEIGLKLFEQGDYRRAMNAFQLALIRANEFGKSDPRFAAAQKAIDSTKPHLNMRAKIGYDTDNKNAKELTGKVTKVFPPSLAWLSGLKKDDRILTANTQDNMIHLKIQRGSKFYNLNFTLKQEKKINLSPLTAQNPKMDDTKPGIVYQGKISHPEMLAANEKLLANYDCALLLDCSGSMDGPVGFETVVASADRTPPGIPSIKTGTFSRSPSRWDWCKQQIGSFTRSAEKYFKNGITLVPFNHVFAVCEKARWDQLSSIYEKLAPAGGTELEEPLQYVIDDYFTRKARAKGKIKPLAIAVVSDGEASGELIRQVIVDATTRMTHPRELMITFLQVDDSSSGSSIIRALDDDLIDAGASYDIVDARTFDELNDYGLLKMIVAALAERQVEGR